MKTDVPIGPSSALGWLLSAAGLLTTVVLSLEHSEALVSGPGKWPAILGVVSGLTTGFGRQLQAAHMNRAATVADDVADVPSALQALAREAQANLASAQASPDGVDGAHVAFSGAPASAAPTAVQR
jgi:hypothetical protein